MICMTDVWQKDQNFPALKKKKKGDWDKLEENDLFHSSK